MKALSFVQVCQISRTRGAYRWLLRVSRLLKKICCGKIPLKKQRIFEFFSFELFCGLHRWSINATISKTEAKTLLFRNATELFTSLSVLIGFIGEFSEFRQRYATSKVWALAKPIAVLSPTKMQQEQLFEVQKKFELGKAIRLELFGGSPSSNRSNPSLNFQWT